MAKPERKFHKRYTLWVSEGEAKQLEEQASLAGLSVSECLRRRGFGGRPVVAQTDMTTVRELRRIGGLLKHHFETAPFFASAAAGFCFPASALCGRPGFF